MERHIYFANFIYNVDLDVIAIITYFIYYLLSTEINIIKILTCLILLQNFTIKKKYICKISCVEIDIFMNLTYACLKTIIA